MTREELQDKRDALNKELDGLNRDITKLDTIIAGVEELTGKYADIAQEPQEHYSPSLHANLRKNVATLAHLQAFFKKRYSHVERAYRKATGMLNRLEEEARRQAAKKS